MMVIINPDLALTSLEAQKAWLRTENWPLIGMSWLFWSWNPAPMTENRKVVHFNLQLPSRPGINMADVEIPELS